MRDDFKRSVRKELGLRAGLRCSNPNCGCNTAGPNDDRRGFSDIGVAAHITAASELGPRFDRSLTSEEREGPENGVWLCAGCAKMVDDDPVRHTIELLRGWKLSAERRASLELKRHPEFRALERGEYLDELEVWERAGLMAVEEELGPCVKTGVRVRAGGSAILFDGVAAKGEQLIAIELYRCEDRGFALWRIPHLVELLERIQFDRFESVVLLLVVVSTAGAEKDAEVTEEVSRILKAASVASEFRMFRLRELRRRFNV